MEIGYEGTHEDRDKGERGSEERQLSIRHQEKEYRELAYRITHIKGGR